MLVALASSIVRVAVFLRLLAKAEGQRLYIRGLFSCILYSFYAALLQTFPFPTGIQCQLSAMNAYGLIGFVSSNAFRAFHPPPSLPCPFLGHRSGGSRRLTAMAPFLLGDSVIFSLGTVCLSLGSGLVFVGLCQKRLRDGSVALGRPLWQDMVVIIVQACVAAAAAAATRVRTILQYARFPKQTVGLRFC